MPYAQSAAYNTQQTTIRLTGSGWTALEASSTWPATNGATTPLARRFAVKVYVKGSGGANRVVLSYDNSIDLGQGVHELGAGQFVVEPCATALTLYGQARLASGVNHMRVVVTEFGY